MEQFINKDALISLALAGDDGSADIVRGKIVRVDGDFIEIELDEKQSFTRGLIMMYYKKTSGKMLLNKKYLISVCLM